MSAISEDYIKKYEPLWGSWYVEDLIGEGSFGKVYKIFKEEWGFRYESALKLISIPTKEQYREAISAMDSNVKTLAGYFEDAMKSIVNEIRLMYTLRGNSNIISYEDHMVEVKKNGEVGWDILIRMEYATSLPKYIQTNEMSRQKIFKLGIDICSALEACSKIDVIHRDIKDENIFFSSNGNFKIGDFGISRELSKSGRAASMKGTPFYMAPEVYRGEKYDCRADLYSLGIVLYKFLNYGRLPFMPPYPQEIKYRDSETALDKRMSGEQFILPLQANNDAGNIILKACSFKASDRFSSASEMRNALEEVLVKLSPNEKDEIISVPKNRNTVAKDKLSATDGGIIKSQLNPAFADTVLIDSGCSPTEIIATGTENRGNHTNHKNEEINNLNNTEVILEPKPGLNSTVSIFENFQSNKTTSDETGNSPGNIVNGGIAALQGLWIYYSSIGNGYRLYKVKLDGSEKTKLCNDNAWFINVQGNWLYYSNASDEDKLYKINLDSKEKTKLNNDKTWNINIYGEWIYYSNESDGYRLYKIKTDGSLRTRLTDDSSHSINVVDGWIYYSNKSDKDRIYKISTDGMGKTCLNSCESDFINVVGEWIYFCNKSDNFRLYKMKLDGSSSMLLNKDICRNINVSGDWIYYCNKSKNSILCKLKINGSNEIEVGTQPSDYITIIDGSILYSNKSDNDRLYKIKPDGTCDMLFDIKNADEPNNLNEWFIL